MTDSTSQFPTPVFVGIDVALDKLDLARSDSDRLEAFANDPDGVTRLVRAMAALGPALIVLEATGGLERPLLDALLDAGLPVALANPAHVRHFAKGLGILAKTDRIDARVLCAYARLASPRLAQRRSQNQAELDALVTCRRQLTLVRTEQSNRRRRTTSPAALKSIDAVLATLDQQVASLDAQIRTLIESDDDLDDLDKRLRSVPGVGPVLSSTVLADLGELGTTDRRQVAALVGVAPFNHDSGTLRGKRAIRGGRAALRGVLYMATVAALRCNAVIKAFAARLRAAGKPPKVVITACMRKLLAILNAMVRDRLTWDQLDLVKNA